MKKNMVLTGKEISFKDNGVVKVGRVLGKGNMKANVGVNVEKDGGMVSVMLEVAYKDMISFT